MWQKGIVNVINEEIAELSIQLACLKLEGKTNYSIDNRLALLENDRIEFKKVIFSEHMKKVLHSSN